MFIKVDPFLEVFIHVCNELFSKLVLQLMGSWCLSHLYAIFNNGHTVKWLMGVDLHHDVTFWWLVYPAFWIKTDGWTVISRHERPHHWIKMIRFMIGFQVPRYSYLDDGGLLPMLIMLELLSLSNLICDGFHISLNDWLMVVYPS